ncbi:CBS domain-containing protein [Rhodospirillaceae bacterium KN72]|uniref:CBS domain-containing protein n=1 Tax=Pacificispira spongiicola TaxID=2729598 RepID=A0A7Y0DZI2_9PROT|nr:CBS domain-containing protein [Pacificispira spongiicola]NMM44473.1 CBS domain-containing protein [Pacificispira spongiicola]
MSVATLLTKKPAQIVTIGAQNTIAEASKLLTDNKIGAVVVVEAADRVVGILSERDIVRGLSARGASVLTQRVADLMTAPVQTCTRSESADSVMRRMSEGRFRHMPVVEGTKLVGVISIGDVVKNRIATLEQEAGAMRDYIMTG